MKKAAAVLLIVLAGVIVWFFGGATHRDSGSTVDSQPAAVSMPENQSDPNATQTAADSSESTVSLEDQPRQPEIQSYSDENRDWEVARGFTTEYNMHFTQTDFLERQAANGDMLAAQLLGYQRHGTEEGNDYLTDAAILGSILSLIHLSYSSESVARGKLKEQRENQESEFDQQEFGIRALEYLFVAEIRGDHIYTPNTISILMGRISYTAQDVSQACSQALERYAELEQARLDKGMPPFDNSPPPVHNSPTRYSSLCVDSP